MPNGKVYYEAERILDEKLMGDELYYSIKWKGIDESGKPWTPTWEPASYCTQPLIESWEQQKRAAKRKMRSPTLPLPGKILSPKKEARKVSKIIGGSSNENDNDLSQVDCGSRSETSMMIDSSSNENKMTPPSSIHSKIKPMTNGSDGDNPLACQIPTMHRLSHSQLDVMVPVPLSLMQQKAYRKIISAPHLTRSFAQASVPLPQNSPILLAKEQLLMVVNHLSLLLSSNESNNWIKDVDHTGKLVMIRQLLKILRHKNLAIGISIPSGLMTDIFIDFLESNGHRYRFINDPSIKHEQQAAELFHNGLMCFIFSTVLQNKDIELVKSKFAQSVFNMNIPVIRLVTKNTIEHAMSYQMLIEKKNLSNLTLSELKKAITYGAWKRHQFIIPGCEVAQFDIKGVCEKIENWLDEGKLRMLNFGMDAAIEKNWDRSACIGGSSVQPGSSGKRICIDVGTSKRKKGKEVISTGDDILKPLKPKKIKISTDSNEAEEDPIIKVEAPEIEINQLGNEPPTFISPNHINSPVPESSRRVNTPTLGSTKFLNVLSRKSPNRSNTVFRSPRRLFTSPREPPKRLSDKATGKLVSDPVERSNTPIKEQKEQNETSEDWKQKFIDLCSKSTQREEIINNLQEENNRSRDLINELSAELASTRRQLGELQGQRRKQQEQQNSEVLRELASVRKELADLKVEFSKTEMELEEKIQENQNMKKEMEANKNTLKTLKNKIHSLQDENTAYKLQGRTTLAGKTIKRTESMDEQIRALTEENENLKKKFDLQEHLHEQHIRIANENIEQSEAINNLLMNLQGKTEVDVKVMLDEQKQTQHSAKVSKELYEAAHHLDTLYDKIDALERFINIVKQTVNDVTNRVEEAEAFITNPINLNTSKSIEPSDLKLPPMRSLNIYRTSDYFPPEAETSEQL
ncbi:11141_t:CDS:2 [Racocetra fulgida]|uniref:11141_t:CDS:1 n=1 Tax=Racocetra fulgida TaxID=60492 RepID=A0A9N9FU23_9GLOM|nr:11141_t:CDS:2 [Racocetra fulgida]